MKQKSKYSEKEKIISIFMVFSLLIIITVCIFGILAEPVYIDCDSGKINIRAEFNSSNDLQNMTIDGIENINCKIKAPAYVLGGGLR